MRIVPRISPMEGLSDIVVAAPPFRDHINQRLQALSCPEVYPQKVRRLDIIAKEVVDLQPPESPLQITAC